MDNFYDVIKEFPEFTIKHIHSKNKIADLLLQSVRSLFSAIAYVDSAHDLACLIDMCLNAVYFLLGKKIIR